MNRRIRISIAVACALGMSAAVAQTVQRGDVKVAQAAPTAPVQVAQAGAAAGGAAGGASAGGFVAGIGVPGTVGSTVVFVSSAVAAAAVGTDNPAPAATSH